MDQATLRANYDNPAEVQRRTVRLECSAVLTLESAACWAGRLAWLQSQYVENTESIPRYRFRSNSATMQSRCSLRWSRPEQNGRKVVVLECLGLDETTLPSVDNKERYLDSARLDLLQEPSQEK